MHSGRTSHLRWFMTEGTETAIQHTSYQWKGYHGNKDLTNYNTLTNYASFDVTSHGYRLCVHVWTLLRVNGGLGERREGLGEGIGRVRGEDGGGGG